MCVCGGRPSSLSLSIYKGVVGVNTESTPPHPSTNRYLITKKIRSSFLVNLNPSDSPL